MPDSVWSLLETPFFIKSAVPAVSASETPIPTFAYSRFFSSGRFAKFCSFGRLAKFGKLGKTEFLAVFFIFNPFFFEFCFCIFHYTCGK